ncbi:MAG TPA: SprT family zinc-dependent metalloprotease [Vicinamibacterales bacterium]|nr:SprT family zinc-dependent metalloprotease [Vicinamibacterales bacterium]
MQLVLPWLTAGGRVTRAPKPPAVPATIDVGSHTYAISIARHRRARRYVLRMTADGALRITVPRGASIAGGVAFAKRQGAWIAREQARRLVRNRAWADGGLVWFRGERVPFVLNDTIVSFGAETMASPRAGGSLRNAFEAHLRAVANVELRARCAELARQHNLAVTRVTIRNQRSRWGSCSSTGAIALNWRLLQMPADVSDYVILHELMHLKQPNHSRSFWREVGLVCNGWRDAEKWLRAHGRELL